MKAYTQDDSLRVLIIDLLDKSLDELWLSVNLLDVIRQVVSKLEILHQYCIVHGDIKPQNIMCRSNMTDWYMIDFGLSHIMDSGENTKLVNTVSGSWLYCSRNIHNRIQSYKNDFESLAFLIIRHIKHTLPWSSECIQLHQHVRGNENQTKNNLIKTIFKKKVETIKLVHQLSLSNPFQDLVEACFNMDEFEALPYSYLKNILQSD